MYYYERQEPEEIAKAIMKVDTDMPYDSRGLIMSLADKFEEEIADMLK